MKYTNNKRLSEDSEIDVENEDIVSEDETDLNDLQSALKAEHDDASDFIDQIGEERAEATNYYLGKKPNATSSLQSEFVSTDLRDSVLFLMHSIMRTFFGTKKVVEFIPNNAEDIDLAKQQTDFVNYTIQK